MIEKIRALAKYLPKEEYLTSSKILRPIHHLLRDSNLWHMNRQSVPKAAFIGVFCAFIPIPAQMLLAAILALASRANLPLSLAGCWLTNPITVAPIFYFCFQLGAWLLNIQIPVREEDMKSWTWIFAQLNQIWWPFLLGSLICAWVGGLTAMTISKFLWRLHVIERFRSRRRKRQLSIESRPELVNGEASDRSTFN